MNEPYHGHEDSAHEAQAEPRNPYEDANAHFEGVGRLYHRRYHRLRPGKDEPAECGLDSMDDDNLRQFQDWIKHQAFEDAIRYIDELEAKIEDMELNRP
jgi:hypothetical protein